jgi:hypothetical protein
MMKNKKAMAIQRIEHSNDNAHVCVVAIYISDISIHGIPFIKGGYSSPPPIFYTFII